MGDLIGYARVSTTEQNPALQLDALHAAGCKHVFCEEANGAVAERPELARALDHLRPGDTLDMLAWSAQLPGAEFTPGTG